ncbi:MAG: DUF4915 domain-containing protein [Chloroflexi bacterium]|nr:DUF4915 domain-containing protein [Chloroflexota bacterium]
MSDSPTQNSSSPNGNEAPALRSVYTSNLPNILAQLNISLAVSAYQAGKVILVRNDGGTVNTHFRNFAKPMGIAANQTRLTIGGSNIVWYYRNIPTVAPKIEPQGKHDACYLPRRIHVTDDIDIHKLAWSADGVLWPAGLHRPFPGCANRLPSATSPYWLEERTCGVWVVNIQTGETATFLRFEEGAREIFAVNILPTRFPEMLEWGDKPLATSYVVPDEALADVPQAIKSA